MPYLQAAGLAALLILSGGCRKGSIETDASSEPTTASPQSSVSTEPFTDISANVGLNFHHFIGAVGDFHFAEISGSGVALFDYDNDGDLDVYLLQGAMTNPDKTYADCLFPPHESVPPRNRLFRNELHHNGQTSDTLSFTDVTDPSGLGHTAFAMGAATGDYDNDGDLDLYLCNFDDDVLYRNNGDGSFTDVTKAAGISESRFTCSATFFDYDKDGYLDLFVTGYCRFSLAINRECSQGAFGRDYCGPATFPAIHDRLYHNNQDGTFSDVTARYGIDRVQGHGLGVVSRDFDGNGWLDIYVANDGDANHLWLNDGQGFSEQALVRGVAYNAFGKPEASMGIAVADYDNDGDADIMLTHLKSETNTLYSNQKQGLFGDVTDSSGLNLPSMPYTAFGVGWLDFDHDSDLDLFVANGEVRRINALADDPFPFHQPNQLFENQGNKAFRDISARAGKDITVSEVSRGAAFGDIDNDGDIDILVSNNNGPARLLRNNLETKNNWLLLRVFDSALRRDLLHARLKLSLDNGQALTRWVQWDGSYASANDPRVHFAWPSGVKALSLEIAAVDGRQFKVAEVPANRVATLNVDSQSASFQ